LIDNNIEPERRPVSAKQVTIDEVHLAFRVPARLPQHEADAVTRTLRSTSFHKQLVQAIAQVCREYPTLARAAIRVTS
jgi:hypothetical protein